MRRRLGQNTVHFIIENLVCNRKFKLPNTSLYNKRAICLTFDLAYLSVSYFRGLMLVKSTKSIKRFIYQHNSHFKHNIKCQLK